MVCADPWTIHHGWKRTSLARMLGTQRKTTDAGNAQRSIWTREGIACMFLIVIGSILAAASVLIITYLVIRAAVRDGIDMSRLVDWKTAYTEAWMKHPGKLPTLQSLYETMAANQAVQDTDPQKRQALVERMVRLEARRKLDATHRDRLVKEIAVYALITLVAALLISLGIATL